MEIFRNVLGLGTATRKARDLVSGVTGAGEPYDQGNAEGMQ
jgi:hypothetical protein